MALITTPESVLTRPGVTTLPVLHFGLFFIATKVLVYGSIQLILKYHSTFICQDVKGALTLLEDMFGSEGVEGAERIYQRSSAKGVLRRGGDPPNTAQTTYRMNVAIQC